MEEAPTLRLEITQGPRAGQALEFNAGKKIGIGRLVRGNAFQIKDSGISSKHLTIEFVSGKWLITDLDSSNGTIVNDVDLDPLAPRPLCDGDVVKIGESTSINVKFEVRVRTENIVLAESNVRRNPRRRAAVTAVGNADVDVVGWGQEGYVDGGVDLEEKKVLLAGDAGKSIAKKKGRGGAAKRNDLKKVDASIAKLEVVEDSDVEVEKRNGVAETGRKGGRRVAAKKNDLNSADDIIAELLVVKNSDVNIEKENIVAETGRRRGRPKRVNVVEGKAAESALASENCIERLKGEGQDVKKSRGGARRGRALKERNGEDESAVADDRLTEVATHVVGENLGGKGGLVNARDLNKKSTKDESAMVDGNCEQPLQNCPLEDGIKKQTRGRMKRTQAADKEVIKEVTAEKEFINSGSETQIDSVNIKKEKISICPSVIPENQVSQLESHEPLANSEVENAVGSDIFEPLEEAGIHLSIQVKEDASQSHKEKQIENSRNEIIPNTQNIKLEKKSLPPSIQEEIPQGHCLKCNEVDEMEGLETHESLEVAGVDSAVPVNFEMIDSARTECQGKSAEPDCLGSRTEGHHGLKLEEMTLGQWFDYLEVYLPKRIHDSTEEMITGMIEKSKRYQEYVSQQQKEKGKVLHHQGS